jgi:hypothetical protein
MPPIFPTTTSASCRRPCRARSTCAFRPCRDKMPSHTSCARDMLHHGCTSPTPSTRCVVTQPLCNTRYGHTTITMVLPRSGQPGSRHIWPCHYGLRAKVNAPRTTFTEHCVGLTVTDCSPSDGLGLLPRVSDTTDRTLIAAMLHLAPLRLSMILEYSPLPSPS